MVLKRRTLAIQDVYVPVQRRRTLDPNKVEALAESMLVKGQEAPILVRPDGTRFVLVEGLHRLEACKALGRGEPCRRSPAPGKADTVSMVERPAAVLRLASAMAHGKADRTAE
jgi:sulfiredoxin